MLTHWSYFGVGRLGQQEQFKALFLEWQVCVQCRGRILQRTQNGLCQVLRVTDVHWLHWKEAKMCFIEADLFASHVFETSCIPESGLIMRTDWEVIRQAANDRTLRVWA